MEKVIVPSLGESVAEATVAIWFKSQGDFVQQDEILCELETDKVTVEVPAPFAGVLVEIVAKSGTVVLPDGLLAQIEKGAAAAAPPKVAQVPPAPPAPQLPVIAPAPVAPKPLMEVRNEPPSPSNSLRQVLAVDAAREKRVPMSKLRLTIARRLKEAQNTAAMLTTFNEVDMGNVMAMRTQYKDAFEKKHGVKLGFMSFFAKACCEALREFPDLNAEISGDTIIYKNFVNLGVAVGTPTGLMVPVVRDAHALSLAGLETAILGLGKKARDGKLQMADLQGGSFTISNGGTYGSLMSSPILNPPQSGIFGMHKIMDRPMAVNGAIVARPMMYTALSYDHRIVDGKGAVSFLVKLKQLIEDPSRILLES